MLDVIIPIYNTPSCDIERCLKSLESINKINKIIMIDDGSKKETAEFLDAITNKKSKYELKHVANGGVSKARNIGLSISKAKYVMFVDSDDTVNAAAVDKACEYIIENDLDFVVGGTNIVYADRSVAKKTQVDKPKTYKNEKLLMVKDRIYSGKHNKSNIELKNIYLARIHAKIFNRKKFQKIKFDEALPLSEDSLFSIDLVKNATSVGIMNNIMYNYHQNEYSVLHRKNNYKDIISLTAFGDRINERIKNEKEIGLKKALIMRFLVVKMTNVKKVLQLKEKELFEEYLETYYKPIKYNIFIINSYKLNFIERLFTLFFRFPYKMQRSILKIAYLLINIGGKHD